MSKFDDFLINRYKESEKRAREIPTVSESPPFDYIRDLYYRMIKSGKYDAYGLKEEACKMLKISKEQLELELKEFKVKE